MRSFFLNTWVLSFLGFAVMSVVGWNVSSSTPNNDSEEVNPSSKSRSSKRTSFSNKRISDSERYMNAIRHAGSSKERMRAAVAMAMHLDPKDFPKWVAGDLFTFCEGPELDIFRVVLFDRWVRESPETLIPLAGNNRRGQVHRRLKLLAKEQPQIFLEHYQNNPNNKLELSSLESIAEHHPRIASERLKELLDNDLIPGLDRSVSKLIRKLAKHGAPELEAMIDDLDPKFRKKAEVAIAGERLVHSFSTEVERLYDSPDGWGTLVANLSTHKELTGKLLEHLDDLPEEWISQIGRRVVNSGSAKEWLEVDLENSRLSDSQIIQLRDSALQNLIWKDPEYLLQNISKSSESKKSQLISRALARIQGDIEKREDLIAQMNPEDQQLAQELLEKDTLERSLSNEKDPTAWLDVVSSLDTSKVNSNTLSRQMSKWDESQRIEAKSSYNKLPAEQKRNIANLVAEAGRRGSFSDAGFSGAAIKSLIDDSPPALDEIEQSPDTTFRRDYNPSEPVTAGSNYAVWLAEKDSGAAISWVSSLPDGNTKLWVSKNLASNLAQYAPKAVERWVETLPTDTQQKIREHMQK